MVIKDLLQPENVVQANTIQSVERAFHILEILDRNRESLPLGDIAHTLGMNKSTTRRFLLTLQGLGYVEQDRLSKRYCVSPRLARLGHSTQDDNSLVSIARPFLDTLSRETGETINFAILDGSEVYYLDKRDSPHPLRLCVEIGGRAPVHATALGKAMLAFLDRKEIEARFNPGGELRRYTHNTLGSWSELELELAQVREEGLAYDQEELFEGLRCMAAPVFRQQKVVGAVSISIPLIRSEPSRIEACKQLLVQQAHQLSEQLHTL